MATGIYRQDEIAWDYRAHSRHTHHTVHTHPRMTHTGHTCGHPHTRAHTGSGSLGGRNAPVPSPGVAAEPRPGGGAGGGTRDSPCSRRRSRGSVVTAPETVRRRTEKGAARPVPAPPQELPEQWTNTKKLALQVKQNVAPLQANEVNILRRKCQQFEVRPPLGAGLGAGPATACGRGAGGPRVTPLCGSLAAQAARVQGEVPAGSALHLQRP